MHKQGSRQLTWQDYARALVVIGRKWGGLQWRCSLPPPCPIPPVWRDARPARVSAHMAGCRFVRRHPSIEGFVGSLGLGKSLMMCTEACRRERLDSLLIVGSHFGFKGQDTVDLNTFDDVIASCSWDTLAGASSCVLMRFKPIARSRGYISFSPPTEIVFSQVRKLGRSMLLTLNVVCFLRRLLRSVGLSLTKRWLIATTR